MRRIRLTVAYDGTNYRGWQLQNSGVTIEQRLNEALCALLCTAGKKQTVPAEAPVVIGASRTDSGVHARGNVAVFDTESRIPAEKFAVALNQHLPDDIRIVRSEEVAADWHPRRQNCVKTYEYQIYQAPVADPLLRLYSHYLYFKLDVEAMRRAAAYLVGTHDFRSFCNPDSQVLKNGGDAVRSIYAIDIETEPRRPGLITIRVQGNGFLYHMIRIIAGTLEKVGMGMWEPEQLKDILEKRDRRFAGPTAPACGLTLVGMEYQEEA